MENSPVYGTKKIGRPRKLTDDERKKRKQATKREWYEKNKKHASIYAKDRYIKLKKKEEKTVDKIGVKKKANANKETRIVSDQTVKTYANRLKSIKKMDINIDDITKKDIEKILTNKNADSTKSLNLVALLDHSKKNNKNADWIKLLNEELDIISTRIQKQKLKNEPTEKQEKTFIHWETIKKVHHSLQESNNISDDKHIQLCYLILSMYVYQCPRRIKDLSNLYINNNYKIPENKNAILWNNVDKIENYHYDNSCIEKTKEENNFLVRTLDDGYFLVMNNYKTKSTYHTQILQLDEKLMIILRDYISKNKLKNDDKLFELDEAGIIRKLMMIFEKYTGKRASVDILRHSFIMYCYENKLIKNDFDRLILSNKMGHSVMMQLQYKFNTTINKDEKIKEVLIEDLKLKKPQKYKKYATEAERKTAEKERKKEWYLKNKQELKSHKIDLKN